MIDYKEQMHLDSKDQKREFAADVTSFSNTNGGYLVFGIKEIEGLVDEIVGIVINNVDDLKLQIESLLRDLIEPRINNIQMKMLPIDSANSVFLIFIPRSYSGPHIVRGRDFFGRNTSGKYKLEYNEIKRRFLETDTLYKEIQNFHIDRIFKIKANQGYMQLNVGSTIILHTIPLSAFSFEAPTLDLGNLEKGDFWPLFGTGADYHVGFEGIGWRYNIDQICYGYHHINRNGIVEVVDRAMLKERNSVEGISINIPLIEQKLTKLSLNISKNYFNYGVDGPFVLKFSLLDVGAARFSNQNGYLTQDNVLQNDMIFPEMIINDFDEFNLFINRVINLLYNAAGHHQRPNY